MLSFGEWYIPLLILFYHTICQTLTVITFLVFDWVIGISRKKLELQRQMDEAHDKLREVKDASDSNDITVHPAAGNGRETS